MTPLLGDCTCHTCQNYTKAYINHLYNVHEMLAQTLLEMYEILCFKSSMILLIKYRIPTCACVCIIYIKLNISKFTKDLNLESRVQDDHQIITQRE
jgi:hypothetical protein